MNSNAQGLCGQKNHVYPITPAVFSELVVFASHALDHPSGGKRKNGQKKEGQRDLGQLALGKNCGNTVILSLIHI